MANANILNAIIGGILVSLSHTIFQQTHSIPLKLSEIFWSLTIFQYKYLPLYMPVISGIFFTSGVLFDCLNYQGTGTFNPFGPKDDILVRTSMYGFALGGFTLGLGSQIVKGDQLYHSLVETTRGNWSSLLTLFIMLSSAFFWSWLTSSEHLTFLSNQLANPQTQYFHYQSANITIGISIALIIVAACLYTSKIQDCKIIIRKILGSFLTGCLISLGFGVCGLPARATFLASITPNSDWSPQFIVFLSSAIFVSAISNLIFKSTYVPKNLAFREERSIVSEIKYVSLTQKIIGSFLFGMGLGISGLDMATFLIHSSIFTIPVVIIFGGFLILGSMIGDAL